MKDRNMSDKIVLLFCEWILNDKFELHYKCKYLPNTSYLLRIFAGDFPCHRNNLKLY